MLLEKNFIASAVGLRTISWTFTSADLPAGKTYIPAGTIILKDSAVKGVALDDVYLHDTENVAALIVAGHLFSDRMPVAPTSAQVTSFAAQGLYFEEAPTTTVMADTIVVDEEGGE